LEIGFSLLTSHNYGAQFLIEPQAALLKKDNAAFLTAAFNRRKTIPASAFVHLPILFVQSRKQKAPMLQRFFALIY